MNLKLAGVCYLRIFCRFHKGRLTFLVNGVVCENDTYINANVMNLSKKIFPRQKQDLNQACKIYSLSIARNILLSVSILHVFHLAPAGMIIDAGIPYNKNSLDNKFYHLRLFSVRNACQSFSGVDACHTSLLCEIDSTPCCFLKTRPAINTGSFLQSSHERPYLRIVIYNSFKQISLPFINFEAPYVYMSGNCNS